MSRVAGQFKLVNADLARKKFEALVEEWPKWELMPEIIEERRRLIDAALDGYLFPVAFNPEPAAVTAEGLSKAGSLLAATGKLDEARLRYQDIVDNFPVEPYLAEAGKFLAAHPEDN
jgi:tetratricopeptide (TPR) repeat protein